MITCVCAPSLHAVINFRFGHSLLGKPLPARIFMNPLYLFFKHRMTSKWNTEIDAGARTGEAIRVHHYERIFIGSEVVIGDNVSISHNVTLGWSSGSMRGGTPIIGNDIHIAMGANISGKIRIANNAKSRANAIVSRSVPHSTLVQAAEVRTVMFPSFHNLEHRT
jgi:serine O-acetyltransferase